MTLTPAQRVALDALKAAEPFAITPARTKRERYSRHVVTVPAHIRTGVNLTVLKSLRAAGLISYEYAWTEGRTTADLALTPAGREA